MIGTIVAIAILAGIPLGLILLRTNSALVVLSLLAGTVIAEKLYADILTIIKSFLAPTIYTGFLAYICVALLPAIILALWYRKSAGKMFFLHLLPAIASGLLVYFIVYDAAPTKIQEFLSGSLVDPYIASYKLFVFVAGALSAIVVFMALYHPSKKVE